MFCGESRSNTWGGKKGLQKKVYGDSTQDMNADIYDVITKGVVSAKVIIEPEGQTRKGAIYPSLIRGPIQGSFK